jgi:hypothetical protein
MLHDNQGITRSPLITVASSSGVALVITRCWLIAVSTHQVRLFRVLYGPSTQS